MYNIAQKARKVKYYFTFFKFFLYRKSLTFNELQKDLGPEP
jgi:hypothetical protein